MVDKELENIVLSRGVINFTLYLFARLRKQDKKIFTRYELMELLHDELMAYTQLLSYKGKKGKKI